MHSSIARLYNNKEETLSDNENDDDALPNTKWLEKKWIEKFRTEICENCHTGSMASEGFSDEWVIASIIHKQVDEDSSHVEDTGERETELPSVTDVKATLNTVINYFPSIIIEENVIDLYHFFDHSFKKKLYFQHIIHQKDILEFYCQL